MVTRRTGACALLAMLATGVHAQDGTETVTNRTPANAQKFLIATPPDGFAIKDAWFLRDGDVTSTDACVTQIAGTPASAEGGNLAAAPLTKKVPTAGIYMSVKGSIADEVYGGYTAKNAGIRKGDQIVSVDGAPIASQHDLSVAMARRLSQGGQATVIFIHDGATRSVQVSPTQGDDQIEIPLERRASATLVIDWAKVEQVGGYDSGNLHLVGLSTPSAKAAGATLTYTVAGTRDRVLAAAKYLQQACDKAKELGF